MRSFITGLVAALSIAQPALAQQERYTPREFRHQGHEYVAVVVGSSRCGWSNVESFVAVIDPMLRRLRDQAHDRGTLFTAIGVAVDDVEPGLAYLQRLAAFDEVAAGNVWLNTGLREYVWGEGRAEPSTPTLVLLERRFADGLEEPLAMTTQVLKLIAGADSIVAFVEAGAPLPTSSP